MKKVILAILLTLAPTLILADKQGKITQKQGYFVGLRLAHQDAKGGTDSNTYGIKFGKHMYDWLDLSISTRLKDKQAPSNSNDTRWETGAKLKHKLSQDWSTSLYLGTGEKFTDDDNYSYWAVTPGIKYKLNSDWAVGTSVRWRNSYNPSHEQQDTTYAVKLGYQFGPNTVLDTRYRIKRGDSDYNELGLGLTFDF